MDMIVLFVITAVVVIIRMMMITSAPADVTTSMKISSPTLVIPRSGPGGVPPHSPNFLHF